MELLRLVLSDEQLSMWVAGFPVWALFLVLAVCIALLSKGADYMVDGAVALARRTGLPRIVIGATIISLGTTTPEMFVSVMAAWTGNPGLALGNGVGSIIFDTGFIFGLLCIFVRVPVRRYILNRTGWAQVGAASLLVLLALGALWLDPVAPILGRGMGALLLALLVLYMYLSYRWARESGQVDRREEDIASRSLGQALGVILLGLVGVVAGSRVLVPVAAEGAARLGVPQDVIAATLVAFGTSVPELMTGISAVKKRQPQIMVGNVVGADVLNCLFVIGAAAFARPLAVPPSFFLFHFPAMLLILYSFRLFIFINKDGWFKRWQGAWLLGIYLVYLVLQYALELGEAHSI
ncbi:MAG: sodium:calcium antiporter [Thermodesulfobacteriota bacterium]